MKKTNPPIWFYEFLSNDFSHLKADVRWMKYFGGIILAVSGAGVVKLFLG